jgi:hypothetical protein
MWYHSTRYVRHESISTHSDTEFDIKNLPSELKPLSFLVGRWRSEFGGKAHFPGIPDFTYGEQVDFAISQPSKTGPPALNYT